MEIVELLNKRIRNKRKILFSKDDEIIVILKETMDDIPRRALILWSFEMAEDTIATLMERYSDDRPLIAINTVKELVKGMIKMPLAKKTILDCHAMAKDIDDLSDIARCHAVGQALSVVHTSGHAIGYPIYDLTALIRENGIDNADEIINERVNHYIERLFYWKMNYQNIKMEWADFIRE